MNAKLSNIVTNFLCEKYDLSDKSSFYSCYFNAIRSLFIPDEISFNKSCRTFIYRTIFVSDIHLGTKASRVDKLIIFIKNNPPEHLYLVGDIIDLWHLSKNKMMNGDPLQLIQSIKQILPAKHLEFFQLLKDLISKGTFVHFLPGNHDETFRDFPEIRWHNFEIRNTIIHTTKASKNLLIMHSDQFDLVTSQRPKLAKFGSIIYDLLIYINIFFYSIQKFLGLPHWSFAKYIKTKIKKTINLMYDFENRIMNEIDGKFNNIDGVIVGHIHIPEIKKFMNMIYMSDGDAVESCSALLELDDGSFELIDWSNPSSLKKMISVDSNLNIKSNSKNLISCAA